MNNLVVDGNLTVGGTTTTVNTETINLADNIITLNSNAVGSASQNAGIEIERGDDTNVTLRWNETTDTWEVTEDGANYKAIVLAGDSVTANAATATALETARDLSLTGDATATLSGFDGSANVSAAITLANSGVTAASYGSASQVPVITVDAKGRITSASTTAVAGVSSTAYNSTTGVLTINTSDGGSFTEDLGVGTGDSPTFANVTASLTGNASTATKLATARTIGGVSFDGSANINLPGVNAAGNQDTSGNAATATALATARTIGLSGDVSGSTTFDGTGNVTITATVADDSHNHTIANVDGLQTALNAAETDAVTTANAYTDTREAAITTAYQTYADQAEVDAKSYADTQIANLVDSAPTTLDTLNELAAALGDDANFSTTVSNQIGTKLDASHDMTLTLSGDASGSATFTNMGNATLTVAVANDSHTHDGRYYTETELSANGTGNTTSGAYKIGTYDEFGNSNSTNVQDVLDDLDAAISTALGKDPTLTINGDASGSATFTNLGNATLTLTIADDSHNHTIANVDGLQTALNAGFVSASASNDTITFTTAGGTTSSVSISDATLSTEQVQDIVGAMVSGNTESDISVTYNDSTGKLNFSVTGGGSVDTATENTFTAIQTFSAGFKSGNPFSYVKNVVDSNTTLTGISGYEIQGASSIIEIANGATLTISSGTTVAI
jgi:hypothetical protein